MIKTAKANSKPKGQWLLSIFMLSLFGLIGWNSIRNSFVRSNRIRELGIAFASPSKRLETTGTDSSSHHSNSKQFINSLGMTMVYIPAGEFLMGSPKNEIGRSEDELQHLVRITKGFYLAAHEVTRFQFSEFVASGYHKTKFGIAEHWSFQTIIPSLLSAMRMPPNLRDGCLKKKVATIHYQPKQNGNTLAEPVNTTISTTVPSPCFKTLPTSMELREKIALKKWHPLEVCSLTNGGYTICRATLGNGAPIGTAPLIIKNFPVRIPLDPLQGIIAYSEEVDGSPPRNVAEPQIGAVAVHIPRDSYISFRLRCAASKDDE